ncbi:MAG: putative thioredoxin [Phycisphaerales bacterium]|nr:putative thioredoxin [Phycisphaerales bacterium]
MRNAYKPVWALLFAAVGMAVLVLVARANRGPSAGDGKGTIAWQSDLPAARAQAAAAGKPVLAYFTASWCPPCQQMKRGTWIDSKVAAAVAAGYVPVMVDVDAQPAVATSYAVESLPRIEAIAPDGSRRLLADRYTGPDEMAALLK